MPYLKSLSIKCARQQPFPYSIPAVKYAKDIKFSTPITFFIGDNGVGKSTLLETLAYRLQLPLMGGAGYSIGGFTAARALMPHLELA